MKLDTNLITNLIMYLILFILCLVVVWIEKRDWMCKNLFSSPEDECNGDDGMPYRGSKANESDTLPILLEKINVAAGAERKSIKWRRAFILGVVIMTLVFVLIITPGSLPSWTKFYTCVIIAFSLLYFSFNYYSYHRFNTPENHINENVKIISKNTLV